jgi:prepilin-type processing-associated H-X9-DG protein
MECWGRFSLGNVVVLLLMALLILGVLGGNVILQLFETPRSVRRRMDCQANLRGIGLGLGQWQADHGGNYPVTVDSDSAAEPVSTAWGRLFSGDYGSDEDIFVCASTEKKIHRPWLGVQADTSVGFGNESTWTGNAATVYVLLRSVGYDDPCAGSDLAARYDQDYGDLLNGSYNYDNARIPRNAAAGRIIAGDGLWRQWMRNASAPDIDSQQDWEYEGVEPNHDDGANVLFADGSAAFLKRTLDYERWIPYQSDAVLADSGTSLETEPELDTPADGADRPCLGARYDWVRQGVIQNPRIEEDGIPNGKAEHDDAYAIEGATGDPDMPDQWWMLSEFQFETGVLVGGKDWLTDGHGRITDTKGSVEGMKRVPKSKIDASIQPFRHYRPGTGQPDDGNDCEFGLQIDAHGAGSIWEY